MSVTGGAPATEPLADGNPYYVRAATWNRTRDWDETTSKNRSAGKQDGYTARDGRGNTIKATAGTPVARQGTCDTDNRIAWAVTDV